MAGTERNRRGLPGCAVVALKRGRTQRIRNGAFVAVLAAFAYGVSVAISKSRAGPFARLVH